MCFATPPEEHRATNVGNTRENGEDRTTSFADMLADRQTDTVHGHHNTSPALAAAAK